MPARRGYITPDEIPSEKICRVLFIPDDPIFRAAVDGALTELAYPFTWEQVGDVTADEAAAAVQEMLDGYFAQDCEATIMPQVDIFYHRENQNVNGGGITANTETKIPFNTAGEINAGNVSLASSVFTLQPGLYDISMYHILLGSSGYKNLYMTDSLSNFGGDDNQIGHATLLNLPEGTIRRILNVTEECTVTFLVQHGTTVASTFFGSPRNRSGFLEVYGYALFTRLGDAQ